MRSPLKVTRAPIGIPSRSLKAAIDFWARVIVGFWPASAVISSTASSRILMFWIASPIPMLREMRSIRGTAMTFSIPNSLRSFGTTSSAYRCFKRGTYPSGVSRTGPEGAAAFCALAPLSFFFVASFAISKSPLAKGGAAALAHPDAAPVVEPLAAEPRGLPALRADDLQVGDLDRRLAFEDAPLDPLVGVRPRVPLDHVHALDDGLALAGEDPQDPAAGAAVLARRDEHLVVLLHIHLHFR